MWRNAGRFPPQISAANQSVRPHRCFAEEGNLRLVGRVDINGFATGAIQIFLDGAFGAVCNTNFGPAEADVACRQLGFVGGTYLPFALNDRVTPDFQRQFQVLYHYAGANPVAQ